MEIRKLDVSEHQDTRGLYEKVFSEDSTSFVEYYYTEKTKDNQIYVVEKDGGIRAMFHLNPYQLMVNGSKKDANYIVAVATQKEYRKRGYMAALMRRALKDIYLAGETFTFLMPAAEAIYLPHDFRTICRQEIREYIPDECLPEGVQAVPAVDSDCQALAEWANTQLSQRYQVYVRRDARYYERLIRECESEGGALMVYRKDGEFVDCRPYYGADEEGDQKQEEDAPKIMARIVDVRRMLMSVRLKSLMAACFYITDPIIEENNRCVVITGTEYSGAMLMDGKPENSEGTITVAALAGFLFGAKNVEDVCKEDGVMMSERMKEELKKMIPIDRIYLNEVV